MIQISEIKWDTDGEDCGLPLTMEIDDVPEDEIADAMSDITGFCVAGFVIDGYSEEIAVPEADAKQIRYLISHEPKDEKECFGEDETFVETVRFPDETEMDVKLCGVQYEQGADMNRPWTEAVLFRNGCEVACSEVEDTFFGDWELSYGNRFYIAHVSQKKEGEKNERN